MKKKKFGTQIAAFMLLRVHAASGGQHGLRACSERGRHLG